MKSVLSVSRRTDIPAFYMPWFMERVARGTIEVVNPFNRRVRQVTVTPERVHSMVFWSKNFGPFLAADCGERLQAMGYHLFFNFTINSPSTDLEPGVPGLDRRLDQLGQLCDRFGSAAVQWRFDPICHFVGASGAIESNLAGFETIAAAAAANGIDTCITSFMDRYRKIDRRARNRLTFVDPEPARCTTIVQDLQRSLSPMGIRLSLCCEQAVRARLSEGTPIRTAACISGRRIMALHGGRVSMRQDTGQRKTAGCGCTVSVDVGSYSLHPCQHNCLFCYANPACDQR